MAKRGRPRHPDVLTPREWEVLALIREALSNEEIGGRLGISVDGAKYHVSEILSKLGVASRQEAAAWTPERRPLWRAAGAPFAFLWRRATSIAPRLSPLSSALAVGLVLAAVVGFGIFGSLVWASHRNPGATHASSTFAFLATTSQLPSKPIPTPVAAVATPTGSLPPSRGWEAAWQVDASTVWLGGEICNPGGGNCRGLIEKTGNGGKTWTEQFRGELDVYLLQFVDAQTGWAVLRQSPCDDYASCPSVLLATTDGGLHWRVVYTSPEHVVDLSLLASDGWLLTRDATVLRTTDGARTWSEVKLPKHNGVAASISRPTVLDAWILASGLDQGAVVVATHDGGLTWSSLTVPQVGVQQAMFLRNAEEGWLLVGSEPGAGAQAKELFGTVDGGKSWNLLSGSLDLNHPPAGGGIFWSGYVGTVYFTSANDGWLTMPRGGLAHSIDGGRTWNYAYADELIQEIRFVDSSHALAGSHEEPRLTSDGGATWVLLPLPRIDH